MYLVYGTYHMTNAQLVKLAERYTTSLKLLEALPLVDEYKLVETEPADFETYRLVHTGEYVKLLEYVHREGRSVNGIPVEAVAFEKIGVGGTLTATRLAISERCTAYHLGGGYHHGMPDRPNSFDYCNDVAIALAHILVTGVEKILYIDLDVHHPDGVQKIFESEPRILQVSLHGWAGHTNEGHYSFIGTGAGLGKKINMPLPPHTGDRIYLQILKTLLASVMRSYQPEVVFYQAGVDPYRQDPIGCLNLSLRGLYERDKLVVSACANKSVPFIVVLGGGYDVENTPRAVVNTLSALAGKDIVFDEPESLGVPSAAKGLRWYGSLRACLSQYVNLDEISSEERKEEDHA
jgi:acetoin utilization protein AcuC